MSPAWQALVILLWIFVAAQAVLVFSLYRQFGEVYLGTRDARSRDGLPLRSEAPSWHATDHRGRVFGSEDFAGRPLVLVFAEPTCTPCKRMMPELRKFAAAHDDVPVVVVGGDDQYDNQQMAKRFGLPFPVLTQPGHNLVARFNVTAMPFVTILDAEGRVREKGVASVQAHFEEKLATLDPASHERVSA